MSLLIFFVAHWYISLFSQTFFDHRYASHRAFTMSPFWEKFFYVFAFVTQGSSYLTPRGYAIMHRMHHAYTDTEKDPHSPKYSKNLFDMMWRTYRFYSDINNNRMVIDKQFTKNLPDWKSFDTFAQSIWTRLVWVAIYVFIYLSLAPSLWWFLLLPLTIFMNPFHGVVINWFAHKYGYTNHKMNNTSKNLMPVDVFMLGEGYHNDHHHRPSNANFGSKWYEIDPVYYIILLFSKLGIIRLNKSA
ncbi:MAG: acyl-CoA desaturase [Flavobacteriales bacterium]